MPVTVKVNVVGVTEGPIVTVRVEDAEPPLGGVTGLVLNVVVTPLGKLDVLNVTAELKPLSEVTVIVEFSNPPTLTVIGEVAFSEKSGGGAFTWMGPDAPVMEAKAVSVAVMICVPIVFRVAEKVCTPASAGKNV